VMEDNCILNLLNVIIKGMEIILYYCTNSTVLQEWNYFAGCIPADEMKFVLKHLPGKVTYKVSNFFFFA
jgi:hypothetical protein